MSDIDFDELDRAVTSALGDTNSEGSTTPDTNVTSDEAQAPSSSISAHAVHARIMPAADSPRRSTLSRNTSTPVADSATTSPQTAPQKRIIPHREGRFMDVVRPDRAPVAKSSPVPTQQQTLNEQPAAESSPPPLSNANSTPDLTDQFVPDVDMEKAINDLLTSDAHTEVSQVEETPTPEIALPEPAVVVPETSLDQQPTIGGENDEAAISEDATLASVLEAPLDQDDVTAVDSPFLPDAKVEKRPLGSGEPNEHHLPTPSPEALAVSSNTVASVVESHEPPVQDITEEAPLPEELQGDFMAIESVDTQATSATKSASISAEQGETAPAGPVSIARQYKDTIKTASDNDESGAIFDPQTYDQPIELPPKKSHTVAIVITIVVVIIVLTVVAVAYLVPGGIMPVPL